MIWEMVSGEPGCVGRGDHLRIAGGLKGEGHKDDLGPGASSL